MAGLELWILVIALVVILAIAVPAIRGRRKIRRRVNPQVEAEERRREEGSPSDNRPPA